MQTDVNNLKNAKKELDEIKKIMYTRLVEALAKIAKVKDSLYLKKDIVSDIEDNFIREKKDCYQRLVNILSQLSTQDNFLYNKSDYKES